MEQRRFILFLTLSMSFVFIWFNLFVPALFPPPPKPNAQLDANADQQNPAEAPLAADDAALAPVSALTPENVVRAAATETGNEPGSVTPPADPANAGPAAAKVQLPTHPATTVQLGSINPDDPYFLLVTLTSSGAAVDSIELNDRRFPEFRNRVSQVKVIGTNPAAQVRTFATRLPAIDQQLGVRTLDLIDWEVVPGSQTPSAVAFRLTAPDGSLELIKTYRVHELTAAERTERGIRESLTAGYELTLTIELKNKLTQPQAVSYALQGPVGTPLEDADNSTKFRDVRMGFLAEDGVTVDSSHMAVATVINKEEASKPEIWKRPLAYVGVDVRYFTALIRPVQNQQTEPTVESAQAMLITKNDEFPIRSDVSVVLTSKQLKLAPAGTVGDTAAHSFAMFAGPKRQDLLQPYSAEVIVFGAYGREPGGFFNGMADFFTFMWRLTFGEQIARGMVWLLNTLTASGIGYGLAIILMTLLVRSFMLPATKMQLANAQKMKDLQPRLKELQQKYAKDREGLQQAQLELYRKTGFNPLLGCLPVLLQMPIFVGLYTALSTAVDLRMTRFLWMDNLASPDALFDFGFALPFLGWTEFNLLPFITILLFVVQQKLTMPPPADEEQAMQYRMMNIMMVVMGAMFYRVPAGLCVYFITSSVWGLVERQFLDWQKKRAPQIVPATEVIPAPTQRADLAAKGTSQVAKTTGQISSWWEKLQSAADKPTMTQGERTSNNGRSNQKPRRK